MSVFCMKICKVVTGSNASFVVNFVVNSRVFADTPKSSQPLMFLSRHELPVKRVFIWALGIQPGGPK